MSQIRGERRLLILLIAVASAFSLFATAGPRNHLGRVFIDDDGSSSEGSIEIIPIGQVTVGRSDRWLASGARSPCRPHVDAGLGPLEGGDRLMRCRGRGPFPQNPSASYLQPPSRHRATKSQMPRPRQLTDKSTIS